MNDDNNDGFLSSLLFIYLISSQVMTLYFWWQWSKTHGFINTILLGPFVSEFKGLLWPFFL
jgi:hypothetical protein